MRIEHPSLWFRIARRFRPDMRSHELYEATRGVWVLGSNRSKAKYAMAVSGGIVREVYKIDVWHPAGTTPYKTRIVAEEANLKNRWEFDGTIAEAIIRDRYVGMDVTTLFKKGAANPATYAGL